MKKLIQLWLVVLTSLILVGCKTLPSFNTTGGQPVTPLPTQTPQHVVLLLPMSGSLATEGQAIRDGYLAANASKIKVDVLNVNQYPDIGSAYQAALLQGGDFIVGPLDKSKVIQLSEHSITKPTLALNYLNPGESSPDLMYQFGLSPLDEARQAADRAIHEGHKSALVIVPTGNWGQNIAQAFTERFTSKGGRVVTQIAVHGDIQTLSKQIAEGLEFSENKSSNTVKGDDYRPNRKSVLSRRQDIDMVFLTANPTMARQIRPLLKFYNAGNLPVYATSLVYTGTPNPAQDRDLDGIMFCSIPWIFNNPPVLPEIRSQVAGQPNFQRLIGLYGLGADAAQLTTQLGALTNSSGASIVGATGTLYLRGHQVQRQLQWAQFRDGSPVLLPNYPADL